MKFLPRPELVERINRSIRAYPVTLLLGPRQSGKTTIARRIAERRNTTYFDLEDPQNPLRPEASAMLLKTLRGLIVVDEFQRQPQLFELLRVLADRRPLPARFLILGSASVELVRGLSESLAGRVAHLEMEGFSLSEVGPRKAERLWLRGGYPYSFLHQNNADSHEWRVNFIQSFLERDIPQLGIRVPAPALRRFWTMLAHVHGYTWNSSELARSMGVKEDTARRYLDILTGSFMIRQLAPWFENVGKRLVKAPKIYFRDSGLLHSLLGLVSKNDVISHPKFGLSWEGFALEQTILAAPPQCVPYFYKTHGGAELDLLLLWRGKKFGFEFKYSDAPSVTRSMQTVLEDLKLERLFVVFPGATAYALTGKIHVAPLTQIHFLMRRMIRR